MVAKGGVVFENYTENVVSEPGTAKIDLNTRASKSMNKFNRKVILHFILRPPE